MSHSEKLLQEVEALESLISKNIQGVDRALALACAARARRIVRDLNGGNKWRSEPTNFA